MLTRLLTIIGALLLFHGGYSFRHCKPTICQPLHVLIVYVFILFCVLYVFTVKQLAVALNLGDGLPPPTDVSNLIMGPMLTFAKATLS